MLTPILIWSCSLRDINFDANLIWCWMICRLRMRHAKNYDHVGKYTGWVCSSLNTETMWRLQIDAWGVAEAMVEVSWDISCYSLNSLYVNIRKRGFFVDVHLLQAIFYAVQRRRRGFWTTRTRLKPPRTLKTLRSHPLRILPLRTPPLSPLPLRTTNRPVQSEVRETFEWPKWSFDMCLSAFDAFTYIIIK